MMNREPYLLSKAPFWRSLRCTGVGVQVDPVFEGLYGGPGSLVKYNPLSNVTSAQVWNFLRAMVWLSYVF